MKQHPAVLALIAAAVVTALSQAQSAANLSGEWKMNPGKSDFGGVPAPELITRSIKYADPTLEISTHQKGAQGETTSELKYTTDGKECVNKMPGGEAKGTAKWQGGNLVIQSVRNFQGTEVKSSETWALSEGGKVLTIASHISLPGRDSDLKLVFEKQ